MPDAAPPDNSEPLVGRTAERAALDEVLASVRSGKSCALVLRGGPGVGKSALLEYAVRSADDLICTLVVGVESEANLAFGALSRVVLPHLEAAQDLPTEQRSLLEGLFGLRDGTSPSFVTTGLAVLLLLTEAARERPLLCLIDDAQWIDAESLRALSFVARRLRAERIGLIFADRDPPGTPYLDGIGEQTVGLMSLDEATDLLLRFAGQRLDRRTASVLATNAGGNALALVEAGRALAAGREAPGLPLDAPLPIGRRLDQHFQRLSNNLPDEARFFLLMAAANTGHDPSLLWRATKSTGVHESAIEAAETSGLIEAAPEIRFRHPLIRSAVYFGAEPADRRRAHQALAAAADETSEPLQRVWHLASSTLVPDESIAEELERCANVSRHHGGYLAAVELLVRSAELTTNPREQSARYMAAGEDALHAGAPVRAAELMDHVHTQLSGSAAKARAVRIRCESAYTTGSDYRQAPAMLLSAAQESEAADSSLARRLALGAILALVRVGPFSDGVGPSEIASVALELVGDPDAFDLIAADQLLGALATLLASGHKVAVPLLRRAVTSLTSDLVDQGPVPYWLQAAHLAAATLWDERAGNEWLECCIRSSKRMGRVWTLMYAYLGQVNSLSACGRLSEAEAIRLEGQALASAMGWNETALGWFSPIWSCAYRGDVDATVALVDRALDKARMQGSGEMAWVAYSALALLHMGRGDYRAAFATAVDQGAYDVGSLLAQELPTIVEAGVRIGQLDEAREALAQLRRRATASQTNWIRGVTARCTALVSEGAEAEACYREASGFLERTDVPIELARTQLLYGEWLRREGRRSDSRRELRMAQAAFMDMGALAFANRAASELRATGAKRPPIINANSLTPQEREIATLAASGLSNKEIGVRLSLSSRTVGTHLYRVFPKLGVHSRAGLRDALIRLRS